MLKEIYNELECFVQSNVNILKQGQEIIENPDDSRSKLETASVMQAILLEIGNYLETVYKLYHTEILTLLEKYCEDLYFCKCRR